MISLVVAVVAVAVAIIIRGPKNAEADARSFINQAYHFVAGPEHKTPPPLADTPPPRKSAGYVEVVPEQREALGIQTVTVKAQTDSLQLELTGTTDFDQNTLAKVRPLFDARVTQVFKSTGQTVKKGDPLVEIYSTTMAQAKADYRTKYGQWVHDKKLVESRRQLALDHQLSNVAWVDTLVAELTSRVNYLAAEDKLVTYGIPLEEIKRLRVDLMEEVKEVVAGKDPDKDPAHSADMQDISKLIIRAPIDGMIVERDVVSGNFYDDMAVLMVISPMEKLWVWGNVYEKDQEEVHLQQRLGHLLPLPRQHEGRGPRGAHRRQGRPQHPDAQDPRVDPQRQQDAQGRAAREGRTPDPAHAGPHGYPPQRPGRDQRRELLLRADA